MPGGKGKITPEDNPKPFTTENQPGVEAINAGKARRRTLKELADALLNTKGINKAKLTAIECGIDLGDDEFTLEVVMTLRQIELAIKKGNTQAYNAAMDRMKGKPMQSVDVTTQGEKIDTVSWLDRFSSKINPDKIDEL